MTKELKYLIAIILTVILCLLFSCSTPITDSVGAGINIKKDSALSLHGGGEETLTSILLAAGISIPLASAGGALLYWVIRRVNLRRRGQETATMMERIAKQVFLESRKND